MDIRALMDRIDSLYATTIEPVVEEQFEPVQKVHPLLQAFNELKEAGIVETVSTGLGGGSAGANGGSMVGGPTTYEQEYGMFKSKGARRITAMTNEDDHVFYHRGSSKDANWVLAQRDGPSYYYSDETEIPPFPAKKGEVWYRIENNNPERVSEALDSSYPYEGNASDGRYTFKTEDNVLYKVYFEGKDLVSVSFSAILPGEEENFRPDKTTLTGTGNSRKVFGTVVKIIKEFLQEMKPNALYFLAANSEPSRIRLYDRLISQVDKELPEYYNSGTVDLGHGNAYMLKRKQEQLDEETTTLKQLYKDTRPDDNERIWDYGTFIWDTPYEIKKITPFELDFILCHQYDVEGIEDLFDRMEPEQHDIVDNYIKDPNLSNQVIVLDDGFIVDGNHRAIAAALTKRPINYIDIADEEEL